MTPFELRNRVTSDYGKRKKPTGIGTEIHRGKDIVPTAYSGEVLLESAWRTRLCNTGQNGSLGVVDKVSYDSARGHYVDVLIRTSPHKVWERHQHMKSISVSVGQKVAQGTVLGVAGSSGNVTGRHLHIGIYVGNKMEASAVEPSAWLGLSKGAGTFAGDNKLDGTQEETSSLKPSTGKRLHVTAGNCQYFSAPDVNAALGMLGKDTLYDVTALASADTVLTAGGKTYKGRWCKFKLSAGERPEHYCLALTDRAQLVDKPKELTAGCTVHVDTAGSTLRVRTGPGTDFAALDSVPHGTTLTVLELRGGWAYSKTAGGWLACAFLRVV